MIRFLTSSFLVCAALTLAFVFLVGSASARPSDDRTLFDITVGAATTSSPTALCCKRPVVRLADRCKAALEECPKEEFPNSDSCNGVYWKESCEPEERQYEGGGAPYSDWEKYKGIVPKNCDGEFEQGECYGVEQKLTGLFKCVPKQQANPKLKCVGQKETMEYCPN